MSDHDLPHVDDLPQVDQQSFPQRSEQLQTADEQAAQAFIDLLPARGTDTLPIRGTSEDMLDLDKVSAHIGGARATNRYVGSADPITYLLSRKCLVDVHGTRYVTRAGLLCFGRHPQELMPWAVVDLGHYRGLDQISTDVVHLAKNIGGTLFEQIERVESYLNLNTHHGMTIVPGSFQRVEIHEYPPSVIRELCANMLAHRDYENGHSASRVMLYRDRIEWATPGGLPPNVTIENILDAQHSRNPAILGLFYEAGYVEAFGQGLDTVFAVLKAEGLEAPYFRDTGESFVAGVYGRPPQVFTSDSSVPVLNEYQRKILTLLRQKGELTPGDLRTQFPERARRSLTRDMATLLESQMIEATGVARAIRYRLRTRDS